MDTPIAAIEDARCIAMKLNFVPAAFQFKVDHGHLRAGNGRHRPRKLIVIFNKIAISYDVGNGSNWLSKFEGDLRNGWRGAADINRQHGGDRA